MENKNEKSAADVVVSTKKTVSGILWRKFLLSLEESTLSGILATVAKVLLSTVLAVSLVDIPGALDLAKKAVYFADFAIPKILGAFLFVFGWKIWLGCSKRILEGIREGLEQIPFGLGTETPEEVPTVRGIPVAEIADYLFETKGWKIRETIERFAIPRSTYDFLASGFDETKIFLRGENNARVLNPDFSRADIVSVLSRVDTEGFRPLLRKDGESSYTHAPSMPEILDRVSADEIPEEVGEEDPDDSPTLPSGFTVRRLDSFSA